MSINLEEFKQFVKTLDPEMQKIYREIDLYFRVTEDTLDDSWQIAAGLVDVFWNYAQQKHDQTNEQIRRYLDRSSLEGTEKKSGQNPPNASKLRPPRPGGSGCR